MPLKALSKTYDFRATEQRIYEWWEKNGFFKPGNDPRLPDHDPSIKPFVISIPPPNVTGELHLGHAMFVSMEDLMIRYHRMKGIPTLWVPGTDHAGIATQLQVERMLAQEGTSRDAVGREEFLRRTWEWKEKYGGIITRQIRRLGASCDWDRERFTLDEGLSWAVREAFVRLYEKGLIYRGPRLINWSPGLKTAVSDLEVEYSEEQGKLYFFKYMLAGSDEHIPVATTRPETILGDTAVAVHPEDPRFEQYVGREAIVPILGRRIPVIADEAVVREFGTGALKITPGHDPTDYLVGQRHNLPVISVLDEAARINEQGGPYAGLDRFEGRKQLWEDMRNVGLVIKEEPYTVSVPRSQRGGEIVEPMISTQWFVRIGPLAEPALRSVRAGRIRIVPERFTKVYYNWLENIEDWCISRQLWWGHRIPVWYCECGETIVARQDPACCPKCGSNQLQQDPDVLDTWFSSGLWPFSTLGWPERTPDLEYFYPTSIMETGYDILFFWVARMIMSGLEFTGQEPFHTVYLHGLIRDEHGKKMSKSYGNVIDPLGVMEELGTDALRFTLLVGSTPGNDMNLSVKKVEANRNFANKLWNAGRFVINAVQGSGFKGLEQAEGASATTARGSAASPGPHPPLSPPEWTLADQWIWGRLQQLVRDVERLFAGFQYGEAGRQIYEFFWSDFADWYVEIAKLQLEPRADDPATNASSARVFYTAQRLARVFDSVLRLLHPFTPFITEELWGHLKEAVLEHSPAMASMYSTWPEALIMAPWPQSQPEEITETEVIAHFALVQDVVREIRNLRSEKNVPPSRRIPATLVSHSMAPVLRGQAATLAALAGLDPDALTITEDLTTRPEDSIALVVGPVEAYLPLARLVDPEEERARLDKNLVEVRAQIERLEQLLGSSFAEKAPAPVVQKERDKLAAYRETAEKLQAQLSTVT